MAVLHDDAVACRALALARLNSQKNPALCPPSRGRLAFVPVAPARTLGRHCWPLLATLRARNCFHFIKLPWRPDDAHGTGTGGEGDCEALCSARAFYNTYTQNTRRMGHRSLGWDENEALAAGGNSPPPRHGGVETVSAAARQQHGCYADLLRSASSKSSSKSERWAMAGRGAPASDFGLRACSKRHRKRFTYR